MAVSRRHFTRLSLLAAGAAVVGRASGTAMSDIGVLYDRSDGIALAGHVRSGDVTPLELLDEAVRRVELVNPRLNAVTQQFYDRARAAIAAGLPQGPFTGVPFLLKDLGVTLEGTVTTGGSRLHANAVAGQTSELVKRYQRAGLVIFGKTNTPEFGSALTTENLFLGDCHNPWSLAHSTGGSSGGTAAAVAAHVLPVAHGTDGGGSIRVPAGHCGVFGFKPTRGVTPGVMGPGMSIGHVLSRSVRDSAAMLDATAGYEAGAPYGAGFESGDYLAATRREPEKLRVALNLTAPAVTIDPQCRDAVLATASLLERLGHHVEEAAPPLDFERLNEVQNILIANGLAAYLARLEKTRGAAIAPAELEPMTWMIRKAGGEFSQFDYAVALEEMQNIGMAMGSFMTAYDVVLEPVTATPAPLLKAITYRDGDSLETYTSRFKQVSAFTHLYNMSGQPSMSLPLAFSREGLPIGVMLSGSVGADAELLSLAAQIERTDAWQRRLPPVNANGGQV